MLSDLQRQQLLDAALNPPVALPAASCQAIYRACPEDFLVEEILGFEPEGEGEHLFLWVEKRDCNTHDVAEQLAKALHLHPKNLGYSGLKDRYAITRQWFSLPWPIKAGLPQQLSGTGWQVLRSVRHPRKLKRGVHQANRFVLRLEITNPNQQTGHWLTRRWQQICQQGVPNYFGIQRFGRSGQNLHKALLLAATGNTRRTSRQQRSLALSALRSALFNLWLTQEVIQQQWQQAIPGNLFQLAGSHSLFLAEDADMLSLPERLQALDIHPTGPLAGKGELMSRQQRLLAEAAFMRQWQPLVDFLADEGLHQERRSQRLLPGQPAFNWQAPWLTLDFVLPSGCFATSLLRELVDAREAQQPHYAKVATSGQQPPDGC